MILLLCRKTTARYLFWDLVVAASSSDSLAPSMVVGVSRSWSSFDMRPSEHLEIFPDTFIISSCTMSFSWYASVTYVLFAL